MLQGILALKSAQLEVCSEAVHTLHWEMALSKQITNSGNPFSVPVPWLCAGSPKNVVELFGLMSHTNALVMFSMQKKKTSGIGTCSKAVQSSPG